jgi:hypothetical protein
MGLADPKISTEINENYIQIGKDLKKALSSILFR